MEVILSQGIPNILMQKVVANIKELRVGETRTLSFALDSTRKLKNHHLYYDGMKQRALYGSPSIAETHANSLMAATSPDPLNY